MKTKRILIITLALAFMFAAPIAVADQATNEAILGLTVEFEGSGNSTIIRITVEVNSVADNDGSLITKFYINDLTQELGTTSPGVFTYETTWDINEYAEGMHVLIAEFSNPSESVHDNEADNRLDLPFSTQDYFLAVAADGYAYIQYHVGRLARTKADGYLSFFADYPIYIWGIVLVFLAVLIILWRKSRSKNKSYRQNFSNGYHKTKDTFYRY